MADVDEDYLNAEIRDSLKVHYSGKIKSLSAKNEKGSFDVLPIHENFISVIYDDVSIGLTSGEIKSFPCKIGIIRVSSNMLHLFLNIEAVDDDLIESFKKESANYYSKSKDKGVKDKAKDKT